LSSSLSPNSSDWKFTRKYWEPCPGCHDVLCSYSHSCHLEPGYSPPPPSLPCPVASRRWPALKLHVEDALPCITRPYFKSTLLARLPTELPEVRRQQPRLLDLRPGGHTEN
jgi:hypothetical protein